MLCCKRRLKLRNNRLVKGASKGEGLGNQFLANIRETDAILHVLRCFDDDNIVHVDGKVNPIRDKETIDMELQLKDLETVDKKLEKVKRAAKTGNKEAQKEEAVLLKIKSSLEAGISVRALEFNEDDYIDFVSIGHNMSKYSDPDSSPTIEIIKFAQANILFSAKA